jgi:tRNA(fMet)-specific endonuclease VapC
MFGAAKSLDPRAPAEVLRMIALAPVLALPEAAGRIYGDIRAALARQGRLIGPNDLWIAAHAIAAGLTLVTNNEDEFRRVEGLKIENWAK